MWQCRPSSSQPGRGLHAAYGLEGVAGGDREAELLVLVGGGDVLVGVGLDAGGDPDHHPRRSRPSSAVTAASRSISSKESTMIRPTPSSTARSSSRGVLLLPWKPIRAPSGSRPARRRSARRRSRRRGAGPPRPASGRWSWRGTPCRRRRRRTPRTRRAKARARSRKSRSSRTYAGLPCSATRSGSATPPTLEHAVVLARGRRPQDRDQRVGVAGLTQPVRTARTAWLRAPSACAQPDGWEVGTTVTSARARRRRAGRGRWRARCGSRPPARGAPR